MLQEVYNLKARELEAAGRLRDAEKLYCSIKAYDDAITMYKRHSMWEHVIRLVAQHCKVCSPAPPPAPPPTPPDLTLYLYQQPKYMGDLQCLMGVKTPLW